MSTNEIGAATATLRRNRAEAEGGGGDTVAPRTATILPEADGYSRVSTNEIGAATVTLRRNRAEAGAGDRRNTLWSRDSAAGVLQDSSAPRDKRPKRGKQTSAYLGFGDTGGAGGAEPGRSTCCLGWRALFSSMRSLPTILQM